MNPKFTVQLTQHTPIIHFQHDQAGATLRATEVKAKLDKFIFKFFDKFNVDNIFEAKLKTTFDPKNKRASLYKTKIFAPSDQDHILLATNLNREQENALKQARIKYLGNVPYFAMEEPIRKDLFQKTGKKVKRHPSDKERDELKVVENYQEKIANWGIIAKVDSLITIQFFSFEPKVLELIKRAIESFFICHNFGTRQTKGFGSFTVAAPKSNRSVKEMLKPFFQYRYMVTESFNNANYMHRLHEQFDWIQDDSRLIKSGRPAKVPGGYRKSQAFLYGINPKQNYRWDKRYIKRGINSNKLRVNGQVANLKVDGNNSAIYDAEGNNSWNDPPNVEYKYIRALLGAAEQYEFQTDKGFKNKYKVTVSGGDIERFPSPLLWKIIGDSIYLVANPIPTEMLGKAFDFRVNLGRDSTDLKSLSTPENFDLGDFLKFVFEENQNNPEPLEDYQPF